MPGPLIDNDLWEVTDGGTEFFGEPEPDAECEEEIGYGPEELSGEYIFAIRTDFCDYLTVTQPTRLAIQEGDTIGVRAFHATLTAPGGAEAHMGIVIGDETVLDETVVIPPDQSVPLRLMVDEWTAPKDLPLGTPILFHVDNHGGNEYAVIELNLL